MVPRCSDKISRVSSYSLSLTGLCFRIQGYHLLWPDFPDCSTRTYAIMSTGLFRFRSPLLTESRLISIPPVTEMFQFTGFALVTYVFSHEYRRSGGFPHSEIFGSKHICRLPEAYRRLPRPSSPSVAKASTMCAYSLDHITPSDLESYHSINWFSNATPNTKLSLMFDIKTNCRIFKEHTRASWLACHEERDFPKGDDSRCS